jgi:hypothetical protein
MAVRHRRADLNGLELFAIITSGGAAITSSSGANSHDADVTCAATGTGDYVLTINPFKGPKGEVYWQASTDVISTSASVTDRTYTGDSLAVTIKVESDASTATDAAVSVHLYAE